MPGWDVAQVCINGHVITPQYNKAAFLRQKYCSECGAPTIHNCPSCEAYIRGALAGTSYSPLHPWKLPSFCIACGEPFPWTRSALDAARALARDADGLTDEERAELEGTLSDLVSDTAQTQVSACRFKRLIEKATPEVAAAMKTVADGRHDRGGEARQLALIRKPWLRRLVA